MLLQALLCELRKQSGLRQEDMARMLGMSTTSYRQKELGQTEFKMSEMFDIADIFDKSISEIFTNKVHGKQ